MNKRCEGCKRLFKPSQLYTKYIDGKKVITLCKGCMYTRVANGVKP